MATGPAVVEVPASGLWRVARGDDPLAVPLSSSSGDAARANRFDPLTLDYGVLYFGTSLEVCFAETLARLRPDLSLLALVEQDWADADFMPVGSVPTDWRQRRTAVRVQLTKGTRFVDIDSPQTHQFLRKELALGLSTLGVKELDVSTVRGDDRRVTQMISEWVYRNGDGQGGEVAGIRYESRLGNGWECWALFDDVAIEKVVAERMSITLDLPDLQRIAKLFDLTVF